jgi:hypothetical protein
VRDIGEGHTKEEMAINKFTLARVPWSFPARIIHLSAETEYDGIEGGGGDLQAI